MTDGEAEETQAERGSGGSGPAPYVTVYVASSLPEAFIVKGHLEQADIPVVIIDDVTARLWGLVYASIAVRVPRTLRDRAEAVLAAPTLPVRRHRPPREGDA